MSTHAHPLSGHRGRTRLVGAALALGTALSLAAAPIATAATDSPSGTADGGASSDQSSVKALKHYQATHGLKQTGTTDAATARSMRTASPAQLRAAYPATSQSYATLTTEEHTNARTVIAVGKGKNIPARGIEIALMAAMQESKFHNYTTAVDHDSLGIFQQRPSTGWGTPSQITNVVTSTQSFYGVASYGNNPGVLQISNWQSKAKGAVAQAVQGSAYPDAYDQWESWADNFYAQQVGCTSPITGTSGSAGPGTGSCAPGGGTSTTKYYVDTFANASVYASPTSTSATGTLNKGTSYVYCKAAGRTISSGSSHNKYWLKTDPDSGPANQWVSAYYLSRWGNDEAKDNSGRVIPDC